MSVHTPAGMANLLRGFQREMRAPVIKIANRMLYGARGSAMKTISSSGWGKAFYAKAGGRYGAKGPATLARLVRVRSAKWDESTQQYKGTVMATGLPGWLELGGHTSPHIIRPKLKRLLVFQGKDGSQFRAFTVHHPGAQVPGTHAIETAVSKYQQQLAPQMNTAIQELADRMIA